MASRRSNNNPPPQDTQQTADPLVIDCTQCEGTGLVKTDSGQEICQPCNGTGATIPGTSVLGIQDSDTPEGTQDNSAEPSPPTVGIGKEKNDTQPDGPTAAPANKGHSTVPPPATAPARSDTPRQTWAQTAVARATQTEAGTQALARLVDAADQLRVQHNSNHNYHRIYAENVCRALGAVELALQAGDTP